MIFFKIWEQNIKWQSLSSVASFIFLMFSFGWKGGESIILIITPRDLEAGSLQDRFRDASSFCMYVKYCLWL